MTGPTRSDTGRNGVGPRGRGLAAILVCGALLAACGGGGGDSAVPTATTTTSGPAPAGAFTIDAQVASYDLVTGKPQRVLIGLGATGGRVVAGGEIEVFFAFIGEGNGTSASGTLGEPTRAIFQPIIGERAPATGGARVQRPSEGVGVYAVPATMFDRAGRWGLLANIPLEGKTVQAQGTFSVGAEHQVLAVGDPAPRTVNPLAGATGIAPATIDSRATDGKDVPDVGLHSATIADALAAGRPLIVVVSTPVYCESRFCGPVTEEVEKLAPAFEDRARFVHLEVWEDFEKQKVGKAAAEWIATKDTGGLQEPWVFVVDRNGTIAHRFDNIAGAAELRAAIEAVTA